MKNGNRFFRCMTCRLLILLFAASSRLFAQSAADSSARKDTISTLSPTIKVTVTRLDVEPEKLPQKIEVIDDLDLKLTPADDITDVLKKNASIDVIQYPGILSGVGIRGFRPGYSGINQRTLTLFDGRPSGATNLAEVQTYDVERIEIVKGPVSALYGPQAMGGVVNIIPKRSKGPVKSTVKTNYGSFETLQAVAHSGGSLFRYLNFDLMAAIYNRGKDYRIGSKYSLDKLSGRFSRTARNLYMRDVIGNGDTTVVIDTCDVPETGGNGIIRHYTKYDKQNFALRIGTDLFDERISVDVRGEMFGADGVETPGDISGFDEGAGFKNVRRHDEEVSVTGDFDVNKFKVLQFWTEEFSERFKDFDYGDTMYMYYSSGSKWLGFQAKDDIHLPVGKPFAAPVLTFGLDYTRADAWSRRWQSLNSPKAPSSPDSRQTDIGVYTQLFGDIRDGFATAVFGLRYDRITAEMLATDLLTNFTPRKEPFNVVSPSYGLTFSPFKTMLRDYAVTLYHNLGKGFMPQSAKNLAIMSVSAPSKDSVNLTVGNPDLLPEENITVDGGIRFDATRQGISLSTGPYYTIVDNFVLNTPGNVKPGETAVYNGVEYPVRKISTYGNSPYKTRMAGLEWDAEWNILTLFNRREKLALSTNGQAVLLSETVNMNVFGTDTLLDTMEVHNVRNPNVTVALSYDDSRLLSFRLSARYTGRQKDTDWSASTYAFRGTKLQPYILYPSFLVVDFSMRVKVNEHNTISASVSNVTDENYYEKRGYNQPGRSFGLSYEISF